jgi:hypothetical protein
MATVQLTVDSEKGITEVFSRVNTIHEALENASLMTRTAMAIRLLHQTAKEPTEGSENPLPVGDTKVFVCACGRRLYSASAAVQHVEKSHASAEIRRDLDALESTVETMITPNPLSDWSDETLPVKSFGPDLIAEFSELYADGNPVTSEHRNRAKALVEYLGWDQLVGISYVDLKKQIAAQEQTSQKKIYKPMHEDFLAAFALLLRQVGAVLNRS